MNAAVQFGGNMDSDWAQGYVTDVLYTEHFFRELSPAWINYVAAMNGCVPRPLDRGFTYMELGCGLGQSVTLLAGAHPQGRFFGVDFNPAHVDWGRRYAASAGIGNVTLLERSFLDMSAQEVPECDFIALHGVYSWVSAEVRAGIRRIIMERLKPGGLVYISYNCLPGWAADSPLQKLVYETARNMTGDTSQRTQAALKAVEELVGAKFTYFAATPTAGKMAAKMAERNANYLAHEFLNDYWTPFYSTDVADDMAEAKLNFVGSATLAENHLELLGNEELQAKIKAQPSQRLRQLFQDLAQNQRFRRDVFVRGHAQLNRAGIARNMEQQIFGSLRDLKNVTNVAKVARGEVKFDEQAFPALKEAFQEGIWSMAELRKEMTARKLLHVDVERTTVLLVATGIALPCAVASRPGSIPAHPKRINIPSPVNRALVKRMVDNLAPGNLVSLLAGNAVSLDPIFAVILSVAGQPWKDEDELKERVFGEVKRRRIRFNKPAKEEKPLDDNARAAQYLDRFWAEEAPVLHRLGVIEISS